MRVEPESHALAARTMPSNVLRSAMYCCTKTDLTENHPNLFLIVLHEGCFGKDKVRPMAS